jgi:very-short-patch-repair endonuclease
MADNLHKGANPKLFRFARLNRKAQTVAEIILWSHLRNRALQGFKFRRQHPIYDFIADFFCPECNLIIEIDGDYHHALEQEQYDIGRTFELNELGIRVIRFTNREVIENKAFVLKTILRHLNRSKKKSQSIK